MKAPKPESKLYFLFDMESKVRGVFSGRTLMRDPEKFKDAIFKINEFNIKYHRNVLFVMNAVIIPESCYRLLFKGFAFINKFRE